DLRTSFARVHELRAWAGRQPQPDLSIVGCATHQQLARRASEQAVTLVRNEGGLLPVRLPAGARIAAIMPQPTNLTPADTSEFVAPGLAAALRSYHPNVTE